jgi:hypothetical protein
MFEYQVVEGWVPSKKKIGPESSWKDEIESEPRYSIPESREPEDR